MQRRLTLNLIGAVRLTTLDVALLAAPGEAVQPARTAWVAPSAEASQGRT